MPKIGRFPPFCKRFFRQARKLVGSCHFAHLWRVVVALASMHGRHSMRKIEAACLNHHTRQSIGFFLTKAQWDAPAILAETALDTLRQLGWKSGMAVNVIFDDTQKKKRGKLMDAVSKIFLHAEKVYAQGHTILGCVINFRGVVIPYAVRLWATQSFAEATHQPSYDGEPIEYCKLTDMVGTIVKALPLTNVTVLFDSYYLCPAVTRRLRIEKVPLCRRGEKESQFLSRRSRS